MKFIHIPSITITITMSNSFVCVKDFEKYAYSVLPRNALDYFRSGAGAETTTIYNRTAFSKYKIRPRCLQNVAARDLSTVILGSKVDIPIGIAPTALQRMAHPEGECATARAAQAMGTIFVSSGAATSSIEEIAKAAPGGNNWLQLLIYNNRDITRRLVQRAEKAGFKAIVLTSDSPVLRRRLADVRNKFTLPPHLKLGNFSGDKIDYAFEDLLDPTLEWKDVKWLKSITKLPVVAKGVLTAEDAIQAAEVGVDAILVSNHGGRQIDGTPATIEVLPEIVKAVGGKMEIFFDGGVTDGTDVFKALALGAGMVFMGRAPLWGLTHSGEDGVRRVLEIVKKELDFAMAVTGSNDVRSINPKTVVHEAYYSKL